MNQQLTDRQSLILALFRKKRAQRSGRGPTFRELMQVLAFARQTEFGAT